MNTGVLLHPPEELLELLVLSPAEISPDLLAPLTAHLHACRLCRSVLDLLLYHHSRCRLMAETEGRSPQAEALIRIAFEADESPVTPGGREEILP